MTIHEPATPDLRRQYLYWSIRPVTTNYKLIDRPVVQDQYSTHLSPTTIFDRTWLNNLITDMAIILLFPISDYKSIKLTSSQHRSLKILNNISDHLSKGMIHSTQSPQCCVDLFYQIDLSLNYTSLLIHYCIRQLTIFRTLDKFTDPTPVGKTCFSDPLHHSAWFMWLPACVMCRYLCN